MPQARQPIAPIANNLQVGASRAMLLWNQGRMTDGSESPMANMAEQAKCDETGSASRPDHSQRNLLVAASVHLVALATSTYVAAIEIESILVSGVVCSATGAWLGVLAQRAGNRPLAVVGWVTPLLAVVLFVLEATVLQLGPRRAALPFCVVFVAHQVIATSIVLVQLHLLLAAAGASPLRVTLKTLLVAMTGFALFSTLAHFLLLREHHPLMLIALGLLGVTLVGLLSIWTAALLERRATGVPSADGSSATTVVDIDAGGDKRR